MKHILTLALSISFLDRRYSASEKLHLVDCRTVLIFLVLIHCHCIVTRWRLECLGLVTVWAMSSSIDIGVGDITIINWITNNLFISFEYSIHISQSPWLYFSAIRFLGWEFMQKEGIKISVHIFSFQFTAKLLLFRIFIWIGVGAQSWC